MDLEELKLKSKNAYNKNAKLKYDFYKLMENINKVFISNKDILQEMIEIDNEKWGVKISFSKMIEVIKENEQSDSKNKYFKENAGSIIYKFPEHPYIVLELAINAIKTKNSIIFITDESYFMINSVLIKLISIAIQELNFDKNTVMLYNIRELDYIEE